MTTLAEHATRIEEMKAAEKRVREWLKSQDGEGGMDASLLLERIDAYEASITWHTDCLTCPKLYDQVYALEQHRIPTLVERLRIAVEALEKIARADYDDEHGYAREALKKLELP